MLYVGSFLLDSLLLLLLLLQELHSLSFSSDVKMRYNHRRRKDLAPKGCIDIQQRLSLHVLLGRSEITFFNYNLEFREYFRVEERTWFFSYHEANFFSIPVIESNL